MNRAACLVSVTAVTAFAAAVAGVLVAEAVARRVRGVLPAPELDEFLNDWAPPWAR